MSSRLKFMIVDFIRGTMRAAGAKFQYFYITYIPASRITLPAIIAITSILIIAPTYRYQSNVMHRYNIGITWHFTPDEGGINIQCLSRCHAPEQYQNCLAYLRLKKGGEVSISGAYPDVMHRNNIRIA